METKIIRPKEKKVNFKSGELIEIGICPNGINKYKGAELNSNYTLIGILTFKNFNGGKINYDNILPEEKINIIILNCESSRLNPGKIIQLSYEDLKMFGKPFNGSVLLKSNDNE